VVFDARWSLGFRSAVGTCTNNTEGERYVGTGQVIPARGFLLLSNTGYNGATAGDGTYTLGLVDSGSVVLRRDGVVVDALCFYFDAATQAALTCATPFVCEGTPVLNPHNNTTSTTSNVDLSLERRGDTHDNAADFATATSNPRNRLGPTTP
jgi:hypothetical protein